MPQPDYFIRYRIKRWYAEFYRTSGKSDVLAAAATRGFEMINFIHIH